MHKKSLQLNIVFGIFSLFEVLDKLHVYIGDFESVRGFDFTNLDIS